MAYGLRVVVVVLGDGSVDAGVSSGGTITAALSVGDGGGRSLVGLTSAVEMGADVTVRGVVALGREVTVDTVRDGNEMVRLAREILGPRVMHRESAHTLALLETDDACAKRIDFAEDFVPLNEGERWAIRII